MKPPSCRIGRCGVESDLLLSEGFRTSPDFFLIKEEVGRSMSYRYAELLPFETAGDAIELGVPIEGMLGGVGGMLS